MLHGNNIQYTEFRHRGILRQFIFCSQIILPISPRRTIYRARPLGGDWWGREREGGGGGIKEKIERSDGGR